MNYLILALGLILGFAFVGVMVYKVLPAADQLVKREYGPLEAYLCTRFCCLCVAMPLYVFTIWMTTVVVFDESRGISVLQEICIDDYQCSHAFAFARENFNKSACTAADCGEENLLARSGSQPLNFPRLGLGQNLSPVEESITYECVERNSTTDLCVTAETAGGDICECVESEKVADSELCTKFLGCDGDVEDADHTTKCKKVGDGECITWDVETDSAKQFSFQSCSCSEGGCDTFTCETLTMEYFYPNVFYAGLVTILFVLPIMIITYTTMKTQLRKILKCGEMKMYVYSQEAGVQNEYTAENLATGGFTEEQKQKSKYRTFSRKDVFMMIVGPAAIFFFSWCAVVTAGRVGLAFVGLSAGLIAIKEVLECVGIIRKNSDKLKDRVEENNPNPARARF